MTYKILPYTTHYLRPLSSLLHDSFDIKTRDKEQFVTWKYFDSFHNNKTITYIALAEDGRVASHYTNIPIPLYRNGSVHQSMLCTDMATARAHRGKGLITQLSTNVYKKVIHNNYDCSFGFSNSEGLKIDKYSHNYGYTIVAPFSRYFKPLIRKKLTSYVLHPTENFHEDIPLTNDYWRIYKSTDYLTWRYLDKPTNDYTIYTIEEHNKIVGYVVIRFSGIRCYVYDIITPLNTHEQMVKILQSIENEALIRKKRLIIYNVLDNTYWKTLFSTANYFNKKNNSITYYLTVKTHSTQKDLSSLLDSEKWLLMGGDII
ncbi:MAG: hypothetical protein RI947_1346 [Candidatus Parcubacteria bacterium]|jgi:hypothetical protein